MTAALAGVLWRKRTTLTDMDSVSNALLVASSSGSGNYLDTNPQDYVAVAYNPSSASPPTQAAIYNYVTNTFVAGAVIPILGSGIHKHIIRFGNTIAVCYETGIVYLYTSLGVLLTTYTLPNTGYSDFNKVAPDKLLALTAGGNNLYSTMITVADNSISLVEHISLSSIFGGGGYQSPAFAPAYNISDGLITTFRGKIIVNCFYSYINGSTVTLRGTVDYDTSTFLYSTKSLATDGGNFSRPSAGSNGITIFAGNMDGQDGRYFITSNGSSGSVNFYLGSTDMHPVHVQGTTALVRAGFESYQTMTALFTGTSGNYNSETFGGLSQSAYQIVSVKDGALIFASENVAQFTKLYRGGIFNSVYDFQEQALITAIPGWINNGAYVRRVQFF